MPTACRPSPTCGRSVSTRPDVSWPQPKAQMLRAAADAGTPVEAGTTEISVTVTVTFRIA